MSVLAMLQNWIAMVLGASSRKVWRVTSLAGMLAAAIVVVGCNSQESHYARNGIGADLYSNDLKRATQNLETYFGFICQQAEIDTVVGYNNESPVKNL